MESPNPLPNPTSGYREGDERSAKRQRVSIACDECRVKKVKCDGIRPGEFDPPVQSPSLRMDRFSVISLLQS